MDWVVGPTFQLFPVAAELVSSTVCPIQSGTGPTGLTVGVGGSGFTVTVKGALTLVQPKILVRLTV